MQCFTSAAPNSTLWTEKTKGKCCGSHTEHRSMSARDRKERKTTDCFKLILALFLFKQLLKQRLFPLIYGPNLMIIQLRTSVNIITITLIRYTNRINIRPKKTNTEQLYICSTGHYIHYKCFLKNIALCFTYVGIPARAKTSAFIAYSLSLLLTPSFIFTLSCELLSKKKPLWITNSAFDRVP